MHTHEHLTLSPSPTEFGAAESSRTAYQMADLGPDFLDFAQLCDCFSIVLIIEMEELGLVPRSEGGPL